MRHRVRLLGLAAAVTLDRSAADEVVQDAFAGLAARREVVLDPVAYLQRSVINLSLKVLRRRGRASSAPLPVAAPVTNPEVDEAWAHVAALPGQQRAVVVLRFWEDLSHEQIATVLGVPLGTVKSSLHRALRSLRSSWPEGSEA